MIQFEKMLISLITISLKPNIFIRMHHTLMGKRLETVILGREARVENSIPSAPISLSKNFFLKTPKERRDHLTYVVQNTNEIQRESSRSVSPFKIKSRRYTSRQISLGTRSETTAEKGHVLYVCAGMCVYMHEFRARIHYVAVKKSQSGDQRAIDRRPIILPSPQPLRIQFMQGCVCVCVLRAALCVSVCSSFVSLQAAGRRQENRR